MVRSSATQSRLRVEQVRGNIFRTTVRLEIFASLSWIDVMGNDDEFSLLLLNHSGDTVDTNSEQVWLIVRGISSAVSPEWEL